jgi:poly(3-hydroxyoctanoate) depolymerase
VSARERTVSTNGIDLFVREQGSGPALLLINGIGGNADMWGPLEERLAGASTTIVFDTPGAGRSSTPSWPLSISDFARTAGTLLDELGHTEVDVLGFSFGGLVAQELAHQQPERVRRLALVGTACGWGSKPGTIASLALISMPVRYHSRTVYERTNRLLSPADAGLVDRLPHLTEARLRYPPPLLGYGYQFVAGMLWSSLTWLHTLRVPTLVLAGGLDHLIPPANGVQLARLLPDARLHILDEEGHLFVLDPASPSHPLLQDFFSAGKLRDATAWATGRLVDDDREVEDAFRHSIGSKPHGALSNAYRRYVLSSRRASRDGAPDG